jgi:hypothetical protein
MIAAEVQLDDPAAFTSPPTLSFCHLQKLLKSFVLWTIATVSLSLAVRTCLAAADRALSGVTALNDTRRNEGRA